MPVFVPMVAALAAATLAPAPQTPAPTPAPITPPAVRREFRGVWLATVSNIDWPTKPGLTTAQQKAELIALLDRAKALNCNAIIFHVRPMCDAMYESPYEPWSEYLTGQDGKAPDPYYDPLTFVIEESHKRGMELHAWFNPYRARGASAVSPASAKHITRVNPSIVRTYGKQLWLDPALPETREYSLKVMVDVAKRYDVDGIHMDDYFYPYPEKDAAGKVIPFPDSASYAAYQAKGGKLSLDDFRRDAVNMLIRDLYREVHKVKPYVKVGLSPFGIAKPGTPPQIKGFDQRSEIYADAVYWLNQGWCDYLAPQLYWPIEQTPQSYPVLLAGWLAENKQNRAIYPGLFTGKYAGDEIAFQVKTTRGFAGAGGTIHFSMKSLLPNDPASAAQNLLKGPYAEPALIPEMPWLAPKDSIAPTAPTDLQITASRSPLVPTVLQWKMSAGDAKNAPVSQYVVQARVGTTWQSFVIPVSLPTTVAVPAQTDAVNVFAVDRYGRAGAALTQAVPAPAPLP